MYYFSGFELNTKSKELSFDGQRIELTKKTYDLLLFLIQHPHQVHTKDELISHVWHGRVVSGNTIDQTVMKLRKSLQMYSEQTFIDSIYAQGIKWLVDVDQKAPNHTTSEILLPRKMPVKFTMVASLLVLIVVLVSVYLSSAYTTKNTAKDSPKSLTVLIQLATGKVDWEVRSASQFLKQLLTFSSEYSIKSTDDKPEFVLSDDFVKNQQKLVPNLTLVKIKPLPDKKQLAWLIEVTRNQQFLIQTTVVADDFQSLIKKSTDIMVEQLNLTHVVIQGLLPQDDHVMALYVRGLMSLESNQLQKAQQQFRLAIEEQPSFHLARLKSAETLSQLGQYDASVNVIDTLLQLEIPAAVQVAASTLKMRILKIRGKYAQAASIYQQLLKEQLTTQFNVPPDIWHGARYEYAAILQYLNQPQKAIAIYDEFIGDAVLSENVGLLADVRAEKASLLQKQGDVNGAQLESERALSLFQLNQDAVGMARTYSVLARIANQKAQYALAEEYLRQALSVTETVGHKLGEGAVLNELIYALMLQGRHQEAWSLNSRLLAIGSGLDYAGMKLAAYQAYFEMSRIQKNWQIAGRWLQSYQQLAENISDERRIAKAQLFHINLLLDQNISDDVAEKIAAVQNHINQTDEILMQATLNVFRGRYQWLTNQQNNAIQSLKDAKALALELEDFESLINANNHLANYYLLQNQPQLALNTLAQSEVHKPFAIPYLRIKAEAQFMLDKNIDALASITSCQQQAPELWGSEEQALLQKIKQALD